MVDDRIRVSGRGEPPGLVDGTALNAGELGHVAADVVTVGVEALRLRDRVEDPVGARVGACSGHPLPVADVAGDVSVDEEIEEVLRA
jgi:hypothetical protein